MHSLGHSLDVVDVPEQNWVTSMWDLVIGHWAMGRWVPAYGQFTRTLAPISITKEHFVAQLLPSLRLVPLPPRRHPVA
jgi:hypothetical protein